MILYQFYCKKCDLHFECEGRITNPPKRKKCVNCEKQAPRAIVALNFKMAGKVAKGGKSNVRNMYNEMIEDSKERLRKPPNPYSDWQFDPKFAEVNGATKLSDKEISKKNEIAIAQTKKVLEVKKRAKL